MNCIEAASLLDDLAEGTLNRGQRGLVETHLTRCDDCDSAWLAMRSLRALRGQTAPAPRAGSFEKAIWTATIGSGVQHPDRKLDVARGRFWLGTGFGGALAASVLLAVLTVGSLVRSPEVDSRAELSIALHETRDVSIAIDSPASFAAAEIRVVLVGAVALAGYQGKSELRWSTPLDRGVNVLRLPVAMEGPSGGHLLVEVNFGGHQKTFAVQLREGVAPDRASNRLSLQSEATRI